MIFSPLHAERQLAAGFFRGEAVLHGIFRERLQNHRRHQQRCLESSIFIFTCTRWPKRFFFNDQIGFNKTQFFGERHEGAAIAFERVPQHLRPLREHAARGLRAKNSCLPCR